MRHITIVICGHDNYKKSDGDTLKVKPNFYGEALTSDEL